MQFFLYKCQILISIFPALPMRGKIVTQTTSIAIVRVFFIRKTSVYQKKKAINAPLAQWISDFSRHLLEKIIIIIHVFPLYLLKSSFVLSSKYKQIKEKEWVRRKLIQLFPPTCRKRAWYWNKTVNQLMTVLDFVRDLASQLMCLLL